MDNVSQEKLIEALVAAKSAEKVAERALAIAVQALSKVRGMEKSTHKVITINSQQGTLDPLDAPVPGTVSYSPPTTPSEQPTEKVKTAEEELNELLGIEEELLPGDIMEAVPR